MPPSKPNILLFISVTTLFLAHIRYNRCNGLIDPQRCFIHLRKSWRSHATLLLYISTTTLIRELNHSRCLSLLTTYSFSVHISKTWNGFATLTLSVLYIYHAWHFTLTATHGDATCMSVMWSSFTAATELALALIMSDVLHSLQQTSWPPTFPKVFSLRDSGRMFRWPLSKITTRYSMRYTKLCECFSSSSAARQSLPRCWARHRRLPRYCCSNGGKILSILAVNNSDKSLEPEAYNFP